MTWLHRNDKLMVAVVMTIGITFMIFAFFYHQAHLTANLTEVDCMVITELGDWYFISRNK